MNPDLILALDQGTTGRAPRSSTATGVRVAEAPAAHAQHHPAPGCVEHDAAEILAVRAAVPRRACSTASHRGRVAGLGITNQRETIVALGPGPPASPSAPAIVWQDGARPTTARGSSPPAARSWFARRTGLTLQPYFSATKLAWLLDHVPGARARAERGELRGGHDRQPGSRGPDRRARHRRHERLAHAAARHRPSGLGRRAAGAVRHPHAVLPDVVPTWRAGG